MGLVFVDFTIITLYAANTGAFHTETFHIKTLLTEALDLFYALAMVVDAFSALFFCGLFDKIGLEAMIAATLCGSFFVCFIFMTDFVCFIFMTDRAALIFIGIVLWGIGLGAEDSIMKAVISQIVPKKMRSTSYGIFETSYETAGFLGSWLFLKYYFADTPHRRNVKHF